MQGLASDRQRHSRSVAEICDALGLKTGAAAIEASHIPVEFVAQTMLTLQGMQSMMVCRASEASPAYNQPHGPKTGVNLTKSTREMGFLTGLLAKEVRFTRPGPDGQPLGHHKKDTQYLGLERGNANYQVTTALRVNFEMIIEQLEEKGDLVLVSYNEGQLCLKFREGRGPAKDQFNGQFVIQLGDKPSGIRPTTFARQPSLARQHLGASATSIGSNSNSGSDSSLSGDEAVERFNRAKLPLAGRELLAQLGRDKLLQMMQHSYVLSTTSTAAPLLESRRDSQLFDEEDLSPVMVFANRPKEVSSFLSEIKRLFGEKHDYYQRLQGSELSNIQAILDQFKEKELAEIDEKICKVVTGDIDTLVMSAPLGLELEKDWTQAYNTFDPDPTKAKQLETHASAYYKFLHARCKQLKAAIDIRGDGIWGEDGKKLTKEAAAERYFSRASITDKMSYAFIELIAKVESFAEITGTFQLARAGNITPHEFVMLQLTNYVYRGKNSVYQDKHQACGRIEATMKKWLAAQNPASNADSEIRILIDKHLPKVYQRVKQAYLEHYKARYNELVNLSHAERRQIDDIPHPDFNRLLSALPEFGLYQHGPEMRNPYAEKFTAEGPWFMILPSGEQVYGENEQQLVDLLSQSAALDEHYIEIHPRSDMSKWGSVVERQLSLEQPVPVETVKNYIDYVKAIAQKTPEQAESLHNALIYVGKGEPSSLRQIAELYGKLEGDSPQRADEAATDGNEGGSTSVMSKT